MRVLLDLPCNHISDQHPIFKDAASSPASQYRDWFTWDVPPYGYKTFFGVAAMSKLNLDHPAAPADLLRVHTGRRDSARRRAGSEADDGSGIAYLSQDTRLDARANRPDSYSYFHNLAGRFKFSPTHEDIACCCNPNAGRLLPQYISRQWMRLTDQPGVAAVLYGACELHTEINGVNVQIEEITDYPFEDTIRLVVRPENAVWFRIALRLPTWTLDVRMTINGEPTVPEKTANGLILSGREWQAGDSVELTLTPRIEIAAYPNGEAAVLRGALQYVLPITSTTQVIKTYPDSLLSDVELLPQQPVQAYQTIFLDRSKPDYGLTFESLPDLPRSWYAPPVRLVGEGFTLVPMGCSMLRRAAFPIL